MTASYSSINEQSGGEPCICPHILNFQANICYFRCECWKHSYSSGRGEMFFTPEWYHWHSTKILSPRIRSITPLSLQYLLWVVMNSVKRCFLADVFHCKLRKAIHPSVQQLNAKQGVRLTVLGVVLQEQQHRRIQYLCRIFSVQLLRDFPW